MKKYNLYVMTKYELDLVMIYSTNDKLKMLNKITFDLPYTTYFHVSDQYDNILDEFNFY